MIVETYGKEYTHLETFEGYTFPVITTCTECESSLRIEVEDLFGIGLNPIPEKYKFTCKVCGSDETFCSEPILIADVMRQYRKTGSKMRLDEVCLISTPALFALVGVFMQSWLIIALGLTFLIVHIWALIDRLERP